MSDMLTVENLLRIEQNVRPLYKHAADAIAALRARLAEAEVDRDRLNQMLRETGQGQGAIDAYASQCEDVDRLRDQCSALAAEVTRLREITTEIAAYTVRNYDAGKHGMRTVCMICCVYADAGQAIQHADTCPVANLAALRPAAAPGGKPS